VSIALLGEEVEGFGILAHYLLVDGHLARELGIGCGEFDAVGGFDRKQGVACLGVQVIEYFLRQD